MLCSLGCEPVLLRMRWFVFWSHAYELGTKTRRVQPGAGADGKEILIAVEQELFCGIARPSVV